MSPDDNTVELFSGTSQEVVEFYVTCELPPVGLAHIFFSFLFFFSFFLFFLFLFFSFSFLFFSFLIISFFFFFFGEMTDSFRGH